MQGELFDEVNELRFAKSIWSDCKNFAKKQMPEMVEGETVEEYKETLLAEARLEFCERLRKMANEIENNTLERQRKAIKFMYGKGIK